jgi:hypothetical protein
MTGKMCCAGAFSPADMCRRMMASMRATAEAGAHAAAEDGTSHEERAAASRTKCPAAAAVLSHDARRSAHRPCRLRPQRCPELKPRLEMASPCWGTE